VKAITMKLTNSVLMLGLFAASGNGWAEQEPPLKTGIDLKTHAVVMEKEIPKLMETAGIPGMSIALVLDGRVAWSRGFGVKNTMSGERVDEHTMFEAASLTKPFFACLAMKLVEAGKLDLDQPLVAYAPEETIVKTFVGHPLDREGFRRDRFNKITARLVLSHSSGLPHGEARNPLPILFEPGEKYRYSAEGYEYLQRIVEHFTGKPLEATMEEMLLGPLGMKDSSMVWRDALAPRSAVGHDTFAGTKGEFKKRTQANAAASLYTTAADYARFVAALMNRKVLKKGTLKQMLSPQVAVKDNVSWSLGFGLERTANGTAFWQWGDDLTFRNYIVAYPEKKIAVVYLTNSQNGLAIGQEILDLVIGGSKDLGLAHLGYARYDTPAMTLARTVRTAGVDAAVRLFREMRAGDAQAFRERDLNWLGYELMNAGRTREAIEFLRANAEAFPDSANVHDSLAEAVMKIGDDGQAIHLYKKAIEAASRDTKADAAFLERLVVGAKESVERLEKRMKRRLAGEEAARQYSRFTGDWRFEVQGFGMLVLKVFLADGLLWGSVEGGVLGDRAEFIPVEGKPLEFKLDSPAMGVFDWEFIANDKGAVTKSRFFHPGLNIRAEGVRER
jgi:CubicO group peptidase (beta-lactamase class C family)